ncbi:MAG TPA: FHA domain-containing protein [Amycolatopsis sp.]|uniref:FHA domain-containing protein n=1 Tax=Amycolatopsis sp. TaxID=37632 RepID=UPI002B48DD61|nr:FHA domain-containing protein [Amycolatopsis sp.]HKS50158.1 FHA domain-containing protein [Amycolatopsis sp.]
MATLSCPQHGPQENADQRFCPVCMEFLVPWTEPIAPEPDADPGRCGAPGCDMPLVDGRCAVHAVGPAPGAAKTTRDPGTDAMGVLQFPWGPVLVGAGEVLIGRSDECGDLAPLIDPYSNVSRRHAVLWRKGEELWVRDQNSLNGTYVNDRKLPTGDALRLVDGDVVRFAADLNATVRMRPDS